jgi:hypothetical protein
VTQKQVPKRPNLFSWPWRLDVVWLVAPIVAVLLRALLYPIAPNDYWWPLVHGRIFAVAGEITRTNLFLYTLPVDLEFLNQPWLAQWWLYEIHQMFGGLGSLCVNAGLLVGAVICLMAVALRRGAGVYALFAVASISGVLGSSVAVVRTQMFAYPCFVFLLFFLCFAPSSSRRRIWIAALAVVVAAWTNLHGTYILAPVCVAAAGFGAVVEERYRSGVFSREALLFWGFSGAVALLACGANPKGFALFYYVLLISSHGSSNTTEWMALELATAKGLFFYLFVIAAFAICIWRRHRIEWAQWCVFIVLAVIALRAQRGLLWWAWYLIILIPPALSRPPAETQEEAVTVSHLEGIVHVVFVVAFLAVPFLCIPGGPISDYVEDNQLILERRHPGTAFRAFNQKNPIELVDGLRRYGYTGRIFHSQEVGGLLQWSLTDAGNRPAVAFVDQRFGMISNDVWNDYFVIEGVQRGAAGLLEKYGIGTLVISTEEQSELIKRIQESARWVRVAGQFDYHVFMIRGEVPDGWPSTAEGRAAKEKSARGREERQIDQP